MIDIGTIIGFDWDAGNWRKSLDKHGVAPLEAEQIFKDENVLYLKDVQHSEKEQRFQALGRTEKGRLLYVTFTLRAEDMLIRVISARDMSKKERACYD